MMNSDKKIKVLSIFGTRPEATKMVPLVLALESCVQIESRVCVTAQHRELLDDVLEPFNIKPEYDLDLMRERQSPAGFAARALTGLEEIIRQDAPDWVLVHGDTTTTFAASLAAFYNRVRVGHVEAGLRTYDKYAPYPEEINRRLTTALADLHFAPTERAREQLLRENVPASAIFVTGNTAIDFLRYTVKNGYCFKNPELTAICEGFKGKRMILMTAHRRESWEHGLAGICRAVRRLADELTDTFVIYPVHPNPVVREIANEFLAGHDRIILTEWLHVFDMHNLMKQAWILLTDSGGLQEEAPSLDVPVVVTRDVTERPEGLEAGVLLLAGTDEERITATVRELYSDSSKYQQMSRMANPFGDGHAADRIVNSLLEWKKA